MQTWQQLLGEEWEGIDSQYGPHSQAVWSAVECLGALEWFEHVGEPIEDANIEPVTFRPTSSPRCGR